mgnify:CR=1 FL=1|jgi:hypothetical protein
MVNMVVERGAKAVALMVWTVSGSVFASIITNTEVF